MGTITIRVNDKEEKLYNEYAKLYDIPLSTLFKQTLEEKIEDEIDLEIINRYNQQKLNNDIQTFSHDEVKNILNI